MNTATELDSRRLKVSLIDIPEEYEPVDSLVEDDTLRRSIANSGVQQSIHVIPAARGRFTLVDGARRVMVSRLEELGDIPAVVHTVPDGVEPKAFRDKLRFTLNQLRQDLLPTQRAMLIIQLMESFHMTQRDVAAYLGADPGSVSNWLSILDYVPEIQRAIDTEEITSFHARAFSSLTPEGQRAIWKKKREVLPTISGKVAHREIRREFSPEAFPHYYIAPEKTLEKLSRKGGRRKARSRPKLSKDDKDRLSRDLKLREVELEHGNAELKQLQREIALASPVVQGILRNPELVELVPEGMREELEVFSQSY